MESQLTDTFHLFVDLQKVFEFKVNIELKNIYLIKIYV